MQIASLPGNTSRLPSDLRSRLQSCSSCAKKGPDLFGQGGVLLNKTARPSPRVFAPSSAVRGALNAFGLFAAMIAGMLRVCVRTLAILSALTAAACGSENGVCRGGSLENYCSGSCRSFDEALLAANALEDFSDCADDATLNRAYSAVGTCEKFRWVMTRPSLDDFTEFFDESGEMVGAIHGTDCNCFCGTSSFTKEYGFVPDCELEPVDPTPCGPGGD